MSNSNELTTINNNDVAERGAYANDLLLDSKLLQLSFILMCPPVLMRLLLQRSYAKYWLKPV